MIANINFVCDTPGCKSTCTIAPVDAKSPLEALEARGWEVTGANSDPDTLTVTNCICPVCAQKKKCCPAGNCNKE